MDAYGTEGEESRIGRREKLRPRSPNETPASPFGALPLKLPEGAHESKAQTPERHFLFRKESRLCTF